MQMKKLAITTTAVLHFRRASSSVRNSKFCEGAGQEVHVPVGSDAGIPLVMESDGSVRSLDAIFSFNPELLDVSAIVA